MSKRETIEEYLARGGVITKLEPVEQVEDTSPTSLPKTGVSSMMSLSEGSLYYAEQKAKKEPKKKEPKAINFAALPAHLMKFVPSS